MTVLNQALSTAEILEAQRLGILPGPQNAGGPPIPAGLQARMTAATPSQISAPQPAPVGANPRLAATIPQRVAPVGPDTVPRVQLGGEAPVTPLSQSIAARRESYNAQLDKLNQPADYSALSGQMRQRTAESMDDMYAAALAGLGPEAVQGFQQPLLKQALAARGGMKVEGGMIDDQGRVMIDPAFQKAKQADALRNRLLQLDQLEARMVSDADKNAIAHERNMIMLAMKQMGAAVAAAAAGNRDKATTWGFTPDGRRIVEDQQGNQFAINPDGSRERFTGIGTQKAPFEKYTGQVTELNGSVARADQLMGLVQQYPKAFGLAATGVGMLPDPIQQRAMPKVLSAQEMQVRGYVLRQAAEEIHKIYGAALTAGEGLRASQWAIGKNDSDQTVLAKLEAAKAWAAQASRNYGTAPNVAAAARGGVPGAPAATPGASAPAPGGLPSGWSVNVKPGG